MAPMSRVIALFAGSTTLVLGLSACGMTTAFGPPAADLTVNGPQGHGRHHPPPTALAGAAPPSIIAEEPSPGSHREPPPDEGFSTSREGGVDVTPHPATPDTEVSYGRNQ
ncbi:hypothetical protein AA101099_2684 [Neoasaia chiangmaiensis NBRC 101099]|nr:hypothetical protein [Neoasaia chiangmaiensis]GBR41945.1 hypothetical protein AA101099_2684 [Neoasaia chiangmaiensis NBRC 101099]GEN14238.1 hypothetical protein NCH01_06690 [Neoasaia chiangmaiensis]